MRATLLVPILLAATACAGGDSDDATHVPLRALDAPAPPFFTRELRTIPKQLEGVPDSPKKRVGLAFVPLDAPRVVAELEFPGSKLQLIVYTGSNRKLCAWALVREPSGEPNAWPAGPCIEPQPCGRLCVEAQFIGVQGDRTVVAGIVGAEGDTIRLVGSDAGPIEFTLDGPLVPGWAGWRAFAADLGRRNYDGLELWSAGHRLARRDAP